MSTSDRRRKEDHKDRVDQPRALIADASDTTTDEPTTNIIRRRKSASNSQKGPYSGIEKFIPKGHVGRIVSTLGGQTERLYDEDWDFARDEHNNKIFLDSTKQVTKDADVKHVLMVKREEFHKADLAEKAQHRSEGLGLIAKKFNSAVSSRDPFFNDVGLHADADITL